MQMFFKIVDLRNFAIFIGMCFISVLELFKIKFQALRNATLFKGDLGAGVFL